MALKTAESVIAKAGNLSKSTGLLFNVPSLGSWLRYNTLLLGLFVFGFILIQAGYPRWLGILLIVAAVGLGMGTVTVNIDVAESAYLIPMVAAVVILLKPRSVNP